jgi:NAD(P)-dependent dehydrogenase (short-subunit alcohol dehydrogenase family)
MPLTISNDLSKHIISTFSLPRRAAAITGGARSIEVEVTWALAEAGAFITLIYTQQRHYLNRRSNLERHRPEQ